MSGDVKPYVMFYRNGKIEFGPVTAEPNGDSFLIDGAEPNPALVQSYLGAATAIAAKLGGTIPHALIASELAAHLYATQTVSYDTLHNTQWRFGGSHSVRYVTIADVHYGNFEIAGGWLADHYGMLNNRWVFLDANDQPIEL